MENNFYDFRKDPFQLLRACDILLISKSTKLRCQYINGRHKRVGLLYNPIEVALFTHSPITRIIRQFIVFFFFF